MALRPAQSFALVLLLVALILPISFGLSAHPSPHSNSGPPVAVSSGASPSIGLPPPGIPAAGIRLSPSSARAGSTENVSGVGFTPGIEVGLRLSGSPVGLEAGSDGTIASNRSAVTSAPDGSFSCTFVVPDLPNGAHPISAGAFGRPAFESFEPTVGLGAWGAALDTAKDEVFLDNVNAGNVTVLDPRTGVATGSIVVQQRPHGIAYDPSRGEIYVADYNPTGPGNVSVISDSNDSVVRTISVGFNPFAIAFDPASDEMFVTNYGSANVSVISDSAARVVATIPLAGDPQGIAYDAELGEMFVAEAQGGVGVINATTDSVRTTVTVSDDPWGVAYDPGVHAVYVSQNSGPGVDEIADATNAIEARVAVAPGSLLSSVAYDPASGSVYVAAIGSTNGSLYAINDSTATVAGPIAVGPSPVTVVPVPSDGRVLVTVENAAWAYLFENDSGLDSLPVAATLLLNTSDQAVPGSTATVSGSGYSADASLTLGLSGAYAGFGAGCRTNATGNFGNCSFLVPADPAGTYDLNVTDARGVVNTNPLTIDILPARSLRFTVEFEATGLPSGSEWSVELNGTTMTSANATIQFSIENGSFPFTVSAPPGYSASPSKGTVTVRGAAQIETIGLGKSSTSSGSGGVPASVLGLPTLDLVALGAAVIALALVAIGWSRRGPKGPPITETEPTGPPD